MTRTRLPNRRPSVTRELEFAGKTYLVSAGFETVDEPTRVIGPKKEKVIREVFISGAKTGQDVMNIIEDASVVFSLALQYGATPAAIARSMGRVPSGTVTPADLDRSDGPPDRVPASIIGAVADLLVEMADKSTNMEASQ